jgi:hypothetical protein
LLMRKALSYCQLCISSCTPKIQLLSTQQNITHVQKSVGNYARRHSGACTCSAPAAWHVLST